MKPFPSSSKKSSICLINLYSKSFSKIGLFSLIPKNSKTYGCLIISLGLFNSCPFCDNSNTFSLLFLPSDNNSLSNNDVSNYLCNSLTDQLELIHSFS